MRKFRNAALAGLTALSLVAGATTATAAENQGSSVSDLKSVFQGSSDDQIWANYMTSKDRLKFIEDGARVIEKYKDNPEKIKTEATREEYQQAMAAYNYFETWVVPQCQDAYDLEAQQEGRKKLAKMVEDGKEGTPEFKALNKQVNEGLAAERLNDLREAAKKGEPGAVKRWAAIENLAMTVHPNMKRFDPVDPNCETNPLFDDLKYASSNPKSGSAVFGKRYNANKDVNAKDLVGSTKNFSRQPIWSQLWIAVTAIGVIGSIIGLIFFPIMNQLKNQQIII